MSVHQACGIFGLSETVYYYKAKNKCEDVVIENELGALTEMSVVKQTQIWSYKNKRPCKASSNPPSNSC